MIEDKTSPEAYKPWIQNKRSRKERKYLTAEIKDHFLYKDKSKNINFCFLKERGGKTYLPLFPFWEFIQAVKDLSYPLPFYARSLTPCIDSIGLLCNCVKHQKTHAENKQN